MSFPYNLNPAPPKKIYAVAYADKIHPEYSGYTFSDGINLLDIIREQTPFFTLEEAQAFAEKIKDRQETCILEWSYSGIVF